MHQGSADFSEALANSTGLSLSGIFRFLGVISLLLSVAIGGFIAYIMYGKLVKNQKSDKPAGGNDAPYQPHVDE